MVLLCFLYWHLESFLKEKCVHIKFSAVKEEKNALKKLRTAQLVFSENSEQHDSICNLQHVSHIIFEN